MKSAVLPIELKGWGMGKTWARIELPKPLIPKPQFLPRDILKKVLDAKASKS